MCIDNKNIYTHFDIIHFFYKTKKHPNIFKHPPKQRSVFPHISNLRSYPTETSQANEKVTCLEVAGMNHLL